MTTEDQVKTLISLTGRLSRVLSQENDLLAHAGRPEGLKELLAEKQSLSGAYEHQVKVLKSDDALEDLDPGLLRRLKESMAVFHGLLSENRARIAGRMDAANRIFEVIADVARRHQPGTTGYGRSGAVATPVRQAYAPPLSVGVNREL